MPKNRCPNCYEEHGEIHASLDTFDWNHIFNHYAVPAPVPGDTVLTTPFASRAAVDSIFYQREGEPDGENWELAGRLKDGRWFYIEAGCDYTGWGCQEGGHSVVASTKPKLIRLGLGKEQRIRAGVAFKSDNNQEASA